MALTRCRFGRKRRLVMAVTCVPMPPSFFALPLRQMMLPLIGPLPVNSQIRAIAFLLVTQSTSGKPNNPAHPCKHDLAAFFLDRRQRFRREIAQKIARGTANLSARMPKQLEQ